MLELDQSSSYSIHITTPSLKHTIYPQIHLATRTLKATKNNKPLDSSFPCLSAILRYIQPIDLFDILISKVHFLDGIRISWIKQSFGFSLLIFGSTWRTARTCRSSLTNCWRLEDTYNDSPKLFMLTAEPGIKENNPV